MKGQKKKASLIEVLINTAIGYFVRRMFNLVHIKGWL